MGVEIDKKISESGACPEDVVHRKEQLCLLMQTVQETIEEIDKCEDDTEQIDEEQYLQNEQTDPQKLEDFAKVVEICEQLIGTIKTTLGLD